MHGYERADDIVGLRFGDSRFTSHPANTNAMRKLIASNYRLLDLQTQRFESNGASRYFSSNLIGIVVNGMLLRVWGVQRDQTELRTTALQLEHSHQQLRSLSGYLQTLREKEKSNLRASCTTRLASHWSVSKSRRRCWRKQLPAPASSDVNEIAKALDEISNALDETGRTVKSISTELRPAVLDKFGLVAAIEWQSEEFSRRTRIECRCNLPQEELSIGADIATALFRILQEALTNVVVHSKATAATVDLTVNDSTVALAISDNGRGITQDEINAPTSLGLLGMRERVEFLKGSFSVSGKHGKGTTIRASFNFTNQHGC